MGKKYRGRSQWNSVSGDEAFVPEVSSTFYLYHIGILREAGSADSGIKQASPTKQKNSQKMDVSITPVELNYHRLRDKCRVQTRQRTYAQILAEHALALVDLAISHSNDIRSGMLKYTEQLTELHGEWQGKIVTPRDSEKWKKVVKRSVRATPYALMKLMIVAFPGKGEPPQDASFVRQTVRDALVGAKMGGELHASLSDIWGAPREMLEQKWRSYSKCNIQMISNLKAGGSRSERFFRAAAKSMEAAIALGEHLDRC